MISDMLPTPAQTLVSSSAWANVYITEVLGLVVIPLAFISLAGIIGVLLNAFIQRRRSKKWFDDGAGGMMR